MAAAVIGVVKSLYVVVRMRGVVDCQSTLSRALLLLSVFSPKEGAAKLLRRRLRALQVEIGTVQYICNVTAAACAALVVVGGACCE